MHTSSDPRIGSVVSWFCGPMGAIINSNNVIQKTLDEQKRTNNGKHSALFSCWRVFELNRKLLFRPM